MARLFYLHSTNISSGSSSSTYYNNSVIRFLVYCQWFFLLQYQLDSIFVVVVLPLYADLQMLRASKANRFMSYDDYGRRHNTNRYCRVPAGHRMREIVDRYKSLRIITKTMKKYFFSSFFAYNKFQCEG